MNAMGKHDEVFPAPVQSGLPLAAKRRAVILFAQFHGLSDVQKALKDEFQLEVNQRDLAKYDCGRASARVGRRLRELYDATRQAWIDDTKAIGIAHQTQRLRLIERVIDKATTARDFNAALKGLELAAKEMGGQLTNVSKTEVTGKVEHRHLSIDDARGELAMRLAAVLEAAHPETPVIEGKCLEHKE